MSVSDKRVPRTRVLFVTVYFFSEGVAPRLSLQTKRDMDDFALCRMRPGMGLAGLHSLRCGCMYFGVQWLVSFGLQYGSDIV